MKKIVDFLYRKKRIVRFFFLLIIFFCFQVFFFEMTALFFPRYNEQPPYEVGIEKFDPTLSRLNSVEAFIHFCDSLYGSTTIASSDSGVYAGIVGTVLRYRFVHGYTYYHLGHNYIATLLAPIINKDLSAIVIPDDILKYPKAACSQQSLVGMKVLMEKGFLVRKVGFYDKKYGGHFCYEVRYNNNWHFYDPNREPDRKLLEDHGRPGIEALNRDPSLLIKAYPKDSASFVMALYSSYELGKPGILPGRNAIIFQEITKFLSYVSWIIFGVVFFLLERSFIKRQKAEKDAAGK